MKPMITGYAVHMEKEIRPQLREELAAFRDYGLYQTPAYQRARIRSEGGELRYVAVRDAFGTPRLAGIIRLRAVPVIGLRIGYVQRGPLCLPRKEPTTEPAAWTALAHAVVPELAHVLVIAPNVVDDEDGREISAALEQAGFSHVSYPAAYRTIVVDLDRDEEQILKSMRGSWRRTLRRAQRADLSVTTSPDFECFDSFMSIYNQTRARKGFAGLDPEIYRTAQTELHDGEKMLLSSAREDGTPVSMLIASCVGETGVALLGGSSPRGLKVSATYLLLWRTLCAARRAGAKAFDLGGIDPEKNPSVYDFKSRLGGTEVYLVGTFEYVWSGWRRLQWRMIEALARARRHLHPGVAGGRR